MLRVFLLTNPGREIFLLLLTMVASLQSHPLAFVAAGPSLPQLVVW